MREKQLARILVEDVSKINKKVGVYINRLLLRIFSVPALQAYLSNVNLVHDDEDGNKPVTIQLDFQRLPEEVLPQMLKLIAAPRQPRLLKYVKDGAARTGVEIEVKPEDFGGEEYDYAN